MCISIFRCRIRDRLTKILEGNEGQLKSVLMKCPHALSLSPSVCQPGGRGASQFVVCGLLVFFILPVRT